LGRPSRIAIKQSPSTFRVDVDGKLCFESDKVRLPLGYNFGITAASAENPDSFEVFKFVVTTESHTPDMADPNPPAAQQAGQQFAAVGNEQAGQAQAPVANQSPNDGTIPSFSDPPEVPASTIIDSAAQFADLHNRLQAMMKHISALNRDISHFQASSTSRSSKLDEQISSLQREVAGLSLLKSMDKKLDEIRQDVRQTKSDLHNALDRKVEGIRQEVRSTHNTMLGRMEERAVGVLGYVLVVVGSQALTVVAYLVYKRRKNGGSKKYL
jgi:mannose-binding lectin 1